MKKWKKLAVFLAVIFLMIYAINFSAYDFSGKRDLYVSIAIDKDYVNQNPHWGFIVPEMLENVSEFYWQEFQIRLIMPLPENYTLFKSPNKLASMKELNFLSKSIPEADIIVGFTGRDLSGKYEKSLGGSDFFMVLITNKYPPNGQTQLLKHELAHLFSAQHRSGTIMDKKELGYQNFDALNKTIIKITKYSNFKLRKFYYRLYH